MNAPSPDTALAEAADALLSVLQRQGVPLPLLVATPYALPPVAALAVSASLWHLGGPNLIHAPAWVVIGLLCAYKSVPKAKGLVAEASRWNTDRAKAWRDGAARRRLRGTPVRMVLLGFLLVLASTFCIAAAMDGSIHLGVALNFAAYATFDLSLLAISYALCAMPRDPDLRSPVPSMA